MAFSSLGQTLAIGNADGTIQLMSAAGPTYLLPRSKLKTADADPILSVAFSPDGRTLASGDRDGTVRFWNVANPGRPLRLGRLPSRHTVVSLAFSRDGRTLAVGSWGGSIRLVDDPAHPYVAGQLPGSSYLVYSVTFSPTGDMLASGSYDGTVRVWSVTDQAHPQQLWELLLGTPNSARSVAFSPDGRTLAASYDDGTIRLWNLSVKSAINRICAIAGALTPQQWHLYVPQLPYKPSCP
jgi:WD40 repeat protein